MIKTEPINRNNTIFPIWRQVLIGTCLMVLLGGAIGLWAAKATLTGAVIAAGQVIIANNAKKVQHSDGGVIKSLNVSNGEVVKEGAVILTLDDTRLKAELTILTSQLIDLTARNARLEAEIKNEATLRLPDGFENQSRAAKLAASAERKLFRDARAHHKGKKDQLELQIVQLQKEIEGLKAEQAAKAHQVDLLTRELAKLNELYKKNLTSITRVYALEREQKRVEGEQGSLTASIARTKHKISETRLAIALMRDEVRIEAQKERRAAEALMAELKAKQVVIKDKLAGTRLRAPKSGIVHALAVHTVGGVITPAETLMLIVPEDKQLTIEAEITPKDIDQLALHTPARLRFTAFHQQTTPELMGHISKLSPDVSKNAQTGLTYYIATISLDEGQMEKLPNLALRPGMPVEALISTSERTALSFLLKPIRDQLTRVFKEE